MEARSDSTVLRLEKSSKSTVACEEEKMNKLKIRVGKDATGRITHGKIISERNKEQMNQTLPIGNSEGSCYQLPPNPDDAFHGFPDTCVPDWVSDDFTGVDLKSEFHFKPTLLASIYSKNSKKYQMKRKQLSDTAPVSINTSVPLVVESPNLKRECQFALPKVITPVPVRYWGHSPLSRKKLCKRDPSEQFEIEVEIKDAPVKCTTRRKSRSEKACLLSSNISISNSHMPEAETDMVCTDPEIPPLFLAASVDDWVEDEISLAEESSPLSQTESIPSASSAPIPPSFSVTDNILIDSAAGCGNSLVSSFSTQQNVPAVLKQSNLVFTEVSSDNNINEGPNPGMVTGSEQSEEGVTSARASVIVINPSQTAKYQVTRDQGLDNSIEVVNLTDTSEESCEVKAEFSSQLVIQQRGEGMSHSKVGRRPSIGRNSISYSGVEINLVIPANNNQNTELKIKLNQNQVEELKNCLKEV